jgi:hypothetical protein
MPQKGFIKYKKLFTSPKNNLTAKNSFFSRQKVLFRAKHSFFSRQKKLLFGAKNNLAICLNRDRPKIGLIWRKFNGFIGSNELF